MRFVATCFSIVLSVAHFSHTFSLCITSQESPYQAHRLLNGLRLLQDRTIIPKYNHISSASNLSVRLLPKPTIDGRQQLLPVIVFIHGQSYDWGTGNAYDGSILSSFTNSIVITFNYRLGILGFLPIVEERGTRANHALWDQIALLHWIRSNIAQFGGDPHNVTIIGHAYGASCAHLLTLSPLARGLFNRVVLMSGSILHHLALSKFDGQPSKNGDLVKKLMKEHLNCDPEAMPQNELLSCLRMVNVDRYIRLQTSLNNGSYPGLMIDLIKSSSINHLFGPILNDEMLFKSVNNADSNDNAKRNNNNNNDNENLNDNDSQLVKYTNILDRYNKFSSLEKKLAILTYSLTIYNATVIQTQQHYLKNSKQSQRNMDLIQILLNEALGETSLTSRWRTTLHSAPSSSLNEIIKPLTENIIFTNLRKMIASIQEAITVKERSKRSATVIVKNSDFSISDWKKSIDIIGELTKTIARNDVNFNDYSNINSTNNDDDLLVHHLGPTNEQQPKQTSSKTTNLHRKRNSILTNEYEQDYLASIDIMFGLSQNDLSIFEIMVQNQTSSSWNKHMNDLNEMLASKHNNILRYLLNNLSVPDIIQNLVDGFMLPSTINVGNYHYLENIKRSYNHLSELKNSSIISDIKKQNTIDLPNFHRAYFYSFGIQKVNLSKPTKDYMDSNEPSLEILDQPYSDLDYLFGAPLRNLQLNHGHSTDSLQHHKTISIAFMSYLSNFIRYGDPNPKTSANESPKSVIADTLKESFSDYFDNLDNLTEWLPYDAFDKACMVLDTSNKIYSGPGEVTKLIKLKNSERIFLWTELVDYLKSSKGNIAETKSSATLDCLNNLDQDLGEKIKSFSSDVTNRTEEQSINIRTNCLQDVIDSTREQLISILINLTKSDSHSSHPTRSLMIRNEADNLSGYNEHQSDAASTSGSSLYDNMSAHLSPISQAVDNVNNPMAALGSIPALLDHQRHHKSTSNSTSSLTGSKSNRKAMAEALTILVSAGAIIIVLNLLVALVVICRMANRQKHIRQESPTNQKKSRASKTSSQNNSEAEAYLRNGYNNDKTGLTIVKSSKSSLRANNAHNYKKQSKSLKFDLSTEDDMVDESQIVSQSHISCDANLETIFFESETNNVPTQHQDQQHQIIFSQGDVDVYGDPQGGSLILVPCDSMDIAQGDQKQQNNNLSDIQADISDLTCQHHHHLIHHDSYLHQHQHIHSAHHMPSSMSPSSTLSDHYSLNNSAMNNLGTAESTAHSNHHIRNNNSDNPLENQVPIFVTKLDCSQYQQLQTTPSQDGSGSIYSSRCDEQHLSQQEDDANSKLNCQSFKSRLKCNNLIHQHHIAPTPGQQVHIHHTHQINGNTNNDSNNLNFISSGGSIRLSKERQNIQGSNLNLNNKITNNGHFEKHSNESYPLFTNSAHDEYIYTISNGANCVDARTNNNTIQRVRNECSFSNESSSSTMTSTNTTYLPSSSNMLAGSNIGGVEVFEDKKLKLLPVTVKLIRQVPEKEVTNFNQNHPNYQEQLPDNIELQSLACPNLFHGAEYSSVTCANNQNRN